MPRSSLRSVACIVTGFLGLVATVSHSGAEATELVPSNSPACDSTLSRQIEALRPGDTLVLKPGVYAQSCALRVLNKGTRDLPIVIAGAPDGGATVITVADGLHEKLNNIELVDSHYLTLRNLHFVGGSMGVRIMGGHHITIENCRISGTQTAAVTLNYADTDHIVIRNNHISDTGKNPQSSGEGIYAGCHDGSCRVTSSVFEHNTIIDLHGSDTGGNDGIEIKRGSGNNIIRHNTISQLLSGGKYPAIFVHGESEKTNLIENNTVTMSTEGIRVAGSATVRKPDLQCAGSGHCFCAS